MKNRVFPILSTNTDLTAPEMIEKDSARWKIESGFKELKHEIGALKNQARKKDYLNS
jgi:IS4 transposase